MIEFLISKADISGFKSYVATFGDGHKILSSFIKAFSLPPLKKNVTWGYFSVSAIRTWVFPALDITSPRVFFKFFLSKTTFIFLNDES